MTRWIVGFAAVATIVAITIMVVRGSGALPDGPVPIAWDREPCAHCRMHVGEPRHAVQLITTDGAVRNFDDVGCALTYLDQRRPAVHRLWFHGEGDAWIPAERVRFLSGQVTPMGSGLVAVDGDIPGARTLAEVRP